MEPTLRVLQQQELPPEAAQLAAHYQLGNPVAAYKIGLTKRMTTYIVMGIIGTIVCGVLAAIVLPSQHESDRQLVILLALFAIFSLGVAINNMRAPLLQGKWRVFVCTEGFVFTKGSTAEAFPWNQIEAVWEQVKMYSSYGIKTGASHKYTVRRTDGVQVEFDDKFVEVELLGDMILRKVQEQILPKLIADFQAGKTLSFGVFSINQTGINNKKELLPWQQVKNIDVEAGELRIKKEGKALSWLSIEVAKVPNLRVFLALLQHVTSQPTREKTARTGQEA